MRKAPQGSNAARRPRRSRLTPRRVILIAAASAGLLWASYATATANPPASASPKAAGTAAAAAAAGAATPFTSYEAESGSLGGGASDVSLTSAPTTQYSSAPLEASGHAYVHLAATGQSVQWTNNTGAPISFINVRYSMPDTSGGGGTTSTLDLYVNGTFRQALNVNSKQTWLYEAAATTTTATIRTLPAATRACSGTRRTRSSPVRRSRRGARSRS